MIVFYIFHKEMSVVRELFKQGFICGFTKHNGKEEDRSGGKRSSSKFIFKF